MQFTRLPRYTLVLTLVLTVVSLAGCRKTPPVEEISVPVSGVSEAAPIGVSPDDWAWWRGPNGNATQPNMVVPTEFGPAHHVLWKSPVPGRGHADPTIVGDRVFSPRRKISQRRKVSFVSIDIPGINCGNRHFTRVVLKETCMQSPLKHRTRSLVTARGCLHVC